MRDLSKLTSLELEDLISANLKKAKGITGSLNLSAKSEDDLTPENLEYTTWALEDLITETLEASHLLGDRSVFKGVA